MNSIKATAGSITAYYGQHQMGSYSLVTDMPNALQVVQQFLAANMKNLRAMYGRRARIVTIVRTP